MGFNRAVKETAKLRIALDGPAGSGKTFTALTIAQVFGRVALLDTERGSASKYADVFTFDTKEISNYHPQNYIDAIREAEQGGFDVLVIDSLSHAWSGTGGALELVDKAAKVSKTGNSFTAWRDVTPLQNKLMDAIMGANLHVIATMRTKTEYIMEQGANGKTYPKKVGTAPIQREGVEFEFDIVGDMTIDNLLVISKTRMSDLSGLIIEKPDIKFGERIRDWLIAPGAPESKPIRIKERAANTPLEAQEQSFLSREEGTKIWKFAQAQGYTAQTVREVLNGMGITSFNDIPADMKEALLEKLANG